MQKEHPIPAQDSANCLGINLGIPQNVNADHVVMNHPPKPLVVNDVINVATITPPHISPLITGIAVVVPGGRMERKEILSNVQEGVPKGGGNLNSMLMLPLPLIRM